MVREIHPESKHVNVCLLPVFINTDTSTVAAQWLRTVGSDVVAHPTWEQSISIATRYLGQMNVEFLMGGLYSIRGNSKGSVLTWVAISNAGENAVGEFVSGILEGSNYVSLW